MIAIGIIGIVAAITIPTMIQNSNSKIFATQLKKSISTLNQASIGAQAQYDVNYSMMSTESADATCGSDSLAKGDMTFCSLLNTTLAGQTYLGTYGQKVKSASGFGLYSMDAKTINPSNFLIYSFSDGAFVGFNPNATNCTVGSGKILTTEMLTEGLADCIGFIDVNGPTTPNREVRCKYTDATELSATNSCEVTKGTMGDIFLIVFHDGTVEIASNAGRGIAGGGQGGEERILIGIDPITGESISVPRYKNGSNGQKYEYDVAAGKYVIKDDDGNIISYINPSDGKTYTYCPKCLSGRGQWYEATKEVNGKTYEFTNFKYILSAGTAGTHYPDYVIKNPDGTLETTDGKTFTQSRGGVWRESTKEVNGKIYEFVDLDYRINGVYHPYVIKNPDGTIESASDGKTYTKCYSYYWYWCELQE